MPGQTPVPSSSLTRTVARVRHPNFNTGTYELCRPGATESSSGETRRQGKITKTGSKHARRLLVEGAWHYRKAPARGVTLQRRQEGQPANVIAISWQAQRRLHNVWQRLADERGKRRTIVAVAVARELAGFVWAVARA